MFESFADADPRVFENQFFHRVGSVRAIMSSLGMLATALSPSFAPS